MKYLLDTDHISFLQRSSAPEHAVLSARMAQHPLGDFVFCVVSFHEQVLGAHAFLARARTTADVVRGYTLLLEITAQTGASRGLPRTGAIPRHQSRTAGKRFRPPAD